MPAVIETLTTDLPIAKRQFPVKPKSPVRLAVEALIPGGIVAITPNGTKIDRLRAVANVGAKAMRYTIRTYVAQDGRLVVKRLA